MGLLQDAALLKITELLSSSPGAGAGVGAGRGLRRRSLEGTSQQRKGMPWEEMERRRAGWGEGVQDVDGRMTLSHPPLSRPAPQDSVSGAELG